MSGTGSTTNLFGSGSPLSQLFGGSSSNPVPTSNPTAAATSGASPNPIAGLQTAGSNSPSLASVLNGGASSSQSQGTNPFNGGGGLSPQLMQVVAQLLQGQA